jgi:hypothetical protein
MPQAFGFLGHGVIIPAVQQEGFHPLGLGLDPGVPPAPALDLFGHGWGDVAFTRLTPGATSALIGGEAIGHHGIPGPHEGEHLGLGYGAGCRFIGFIGHDASYLVSGGSGA